MRVEPHDIRLKRLRIRSWRRGMKEMDLLLGPFSDGPIAALDCATLDGYEAMLEENDQELYRWFSGASTPPVEHAALIALILESRKSA